MSLLRLLGLVVAAAFLVFLHRQLGRRAPAAGDGLVLVVALILAFVSLFPNTLNFAARLLHFSHYGRGRVILLLVLSNIALWWYAAWSVGAARRSEERQNRLLETVLAHVAAEPGPPPPEGPHIAIVLPAYNEVESIGPVLEGLPDRLGDLPVRPVVVSDGSTDGTAAVAKAKGAFVLDLPINVGGGAAIRIGYNRAVADGAVAVVTMDADGQHRPEDLPALVEPVLAGTADVVIGSRRLGSFERVSGLRTIGLDFFNALLNLLLHTNLTDCSSGLRAFRAAAMPRLETTERQYHTAETIMLAKRAGLRIAEVPIRARRRLAGTSKKGSDLIYGYRFARVLLSKWIRG